MAPCDTDRGVRIGICSYWFNRGQGVVSRQVRSALETLGHETAVLARPSKPGSGVPSFVDHTDVWDQSGVTEASQYEIPAHEYLGWAGEQGIEVCFFDQNYGFEAIEALRRSGVRTIGRFVWEQFSRDDVEPAKRAFDLIYSLTGCERRRYARLGIDSGRVRWGIHPELLRDGTDGADDRGDEVVYFFPGGYMTRRKPARPVVEAFSQTNDPRLRLVVKGQVRREKLGWLEQASRRDPRIEVVLDDLPIAEHQRLFGSADVCLAPSRWEGLGLHLFEAMAFGMPVITNDNPPMNEVVEDSFNGLLVGAEQRGRATSGIPAYTPDVGELREAIERLAEPSLREQLAGGAREARRRLSWRRTMRDYAKLVERVG